MLGELGGRRTERLQRIKSALEAGGFRVAISDRMDGLLETGEMLTTPGSLLFTQAED
jgi:hypothetical protein